MNTPFKSQSKEHEPSTEVQQATDTDTLKKLDAEQKRLCILEAALKQACEEKQQSVDLLLDTREMCLNQENSMKKLREENTRLEQTNIRLEGKLQQTVAQLEEHRQEQSQQLKDQLSRGADQLDRKQAELEKMTERYNALQSDFEAMVLENDVKINELKGCLGLADQLKPENIRQQQYIKELEAKIASLEHTIALLSKHSDGIQDELNSMDALLQNNPTCSRPQGCSAPLSIVECMGNLHRALANPKDNTDEIIKLQKLLEERDRNLLLLQEKERRSSGKLAALNEEKTRLKNDVMYMQKELGELQQKDQL